MSLYAGIDAGTQSIKLLVYDVQSRQVVATASAPLELISGADGSREQLAWWWIEGLHNCFAQLDWAIRASIVAIGVSGQQHGFVPLGHYGEVLAPVKLWCDTSSIHECQQIMHAVGGEGRCIELAGNPILPGYTASKLPWTRHHRPEVYRDLAVILLPHDYLNFYLSGERFMEAGDASGTGWLDVRTRQWSPELLAATDPDRDLSQCLPPLVELGTTFPIVPAVADALGLPHGVRIAVGGGDNMMAAIGTGCVVPGRLSMSLGTSGTLFAYADHPVVDANGGWAAFCSSSGGWLPLICTMNCTVATETIARLFDFGVGQGEAMIGATSPGAAGLTLLPFFNGERTPNLPDARASMLGMNLGNVTPANCYRAAMEGASYTLKYGYDAFAAAGLEFDAIVLTGGGANSAAWKQMIADVFDLPVEVPQQAEGAAFGAALQALWSHLRENGGRTSLPELVAQHAAIDLSLSIRPDPVSVDEYQTHYARFLRHLDAVRALDAAKAITAHNKTEDRP
ncbi:MAG: xylulokinase [Lysobacter sp.]